MKKFEEEIFGKVETMITQPGCSMTRKVWYKADDIHELSKDWVSPEDHQKVVDDLTNARSSITNLMAQLDYYKKDKRFEAMAEEILSLKSQLEKQQPEIPEFVAKWIEYVKQKHHNALALLSDENMPDDVNEWLFFQRNDDNINLILRAWLNGYTVKEKRFYLKNKLTGLYLATEDGGNTYIEIGRKWLNPRRVTSYNAIFSQQEIDSMETGSYEQIEVEE